MNAKRRSYEAGHRPKFMVVVDETPECGRAIRFAARRAARTGASLIMLAVAEPPASFELFGVGEAMRAEAEDDARQRLEARRRRRARPRASSPSRSCATATPPRRSPA